jgi:hypothetical protein
VVDGVGQAVRLLRLRPLSDAVDKVARRLRYWQARNGTPARYLFHWANLELAEEYRAALDAPGRRAANRA